MKVLLDIDDKVASKYFEAFNNLPFVKAKKLTYEKAEILSDISDSVEEIKKVIDGELEARDVEELLDEL